MGSPKSSHQKHPRCWMCENWTPFGETSFPPPKNTMGNCPATNGLTSAYGDRIVYCPTGKLDPERIKGASVDQCPEIGVADQEGMVNKAKIKASRHMLPRGIVMVGRAGLTKSELDLLIKCGFAERRSSGFHARLFVTEGSLPEARMLADGDNQ